MTGEAIVAEARKALGTRWHHQGRQPGVGLDCAGLIVVVAAALRLQVTDVAGYGRIPEGARLYRLLESQLIPVAAPGPGDVALIAYDADPQHLAFVGDYLYGGLSLIHAYSVAGKGRVIEHRLSPEWEARIQGYYRFPEVA